MQQNIILYNPTFSCTIDRSCELRACGKSITATIMIAVMKNYKNVDPITRAHFDTHLVAAVDAKVPFADIAIGPDQFIRMHCRGIITKAE